MSHVDPEQFPIMHTIGKEGLTVPHLGQPAWLMLGGSALKLVPEVGPPAEQPRGYKLLNRAHPGGVIEDAINKTDAETKILPDGVLYLHHGELTTIGRADSRSLKLPYEVAETHASISIDEGGVTIIPKKSANDTRLYISEEDSRKPQIELVETPPLHDKYGNFFYWKLNEMFGDRATDSSGSDIISLKTAETDIAAATLNNDRNEPVFEVDIFAMGADVLGASRDPSLKGNLNTIKPDENMAARRIIIDPNRPGILIESVGRLIERPNSHAFKNNRSEQLSEGQALGLADLLDILEDRGV